MIYDAQARKDYKAQARADIRKKFWPTIGAVILASIPLALMSIIMSIGAEGFDTLGDASSLDAVVSVYGKFAQYSLLYLVIYFFVGSPITFGAKHYYVARARGESSTVGLIFQPFTSGKSYLTSLKLSLSIGIRSLGWLVIVCAMALVGLIPLFAFSPADNVGSGAFLLFFVIYIVVVCVVSVWASVKMRRYDGAYICLIDTPDASVWQATGACAKIFKNHNWELMVFDLSFLLWNCLTAITFGVVGLYVIPYQEIAFVHYFDALCGRTPEPAEEPSLSE